MSKSVLFVIKTLSEGGAEKVSALLASSFAENYNMTTYIAVLNQREQEYYISDKVHKYTLSKHSVNKWVEMKYEYMFLKQLTDELVPDYVLSLDSYRTNILLEMGWMFNKTYKLVLSERNNPRKIPKKFTGKILRTLSYYLCDALVFQTEGARHYFSKAIINKSVVISNPVSIEKNIETIPWELRKKRIVNCSRLVPQKNISLLIKAFYRISNIYPDYCLDIYGEGKQEKKLKSLVKKLNISDKVTFHGFVKNALIEICDACMYVSSSDFEGISNSILEAMAVGIPVVCTDCPSGGTRVIVRDGIDGLLSAVGDEKSLAQNMMRIIENYELGKQMSEKSQEVIERFSLEAISSMWIEYMSAV